MVGALGRWVAGGPLVQVQKVSGTKMRNKNWQN